MPCFRPRAPWVASTQPSARSGVYPAIVCGLLSTLAACSSLPSLQGEPLAAFQHQPASARSTTLQHEDATPPAVAGHFAEAMDEARTALHETDAGVHQRLDPAQHESGAISLATRNLEARVLLAALAREYGLTLSIVGDLAGSVTLSGTDQTLDALLDDITHQVDAYWHVVGNTLRIEGAPRFSASHTIDYLNIRRQTQSRVALATEVGSLSRGSDPLVVNNSSETLLVNEAEQDFWAALKVDIEALRDTLDASAAVSINPEAGLVQVEGTARLHRAVAAQLDKLQSRSHGQVLIEATVVELTLSDRFSAGVDWRWLADGIEGIMATQSLLGLPLPGANEAPAVSAPEALFSVVSENARGSVRATLQLLESIGDIRILSRPRIIALNNQSSVLKVVDNRVYFSVQVERRRNDDEDELITSTEIHTVPVGLVMVVTPQIGESGEVMLNVRPTLSRILGFVNDPNPALAAAQVRNSVPEIQVREMESMLRVRSGALAVIGGLMQESSQRNHRGVPLLEHIPLIGNVFRQRDREQRQTELLVVLRPSILPLQQSRQRRLAALLTWHESDRRVSAVRVERLSAGDAGND